MSLNKSQKEAMKHPNVLGAGAAKRRKLPPRQRGSVIAAEYERGTLHSGSGKIVKNPAQMRAIVFSETHPQGKSHPHSIKRKYKGDKHG